MCLDLATNHVYISRHVVFDEHNFPAKKLTVFNSPSNQNSTAIKSLIIPALFWIHNDVLQWAENLMHWWRMTLGFYIHVHLVNILCAMSRYIRWKRNLMVVLNVSKLDLWLKGMIKLVELISMKLSLLWLNWQPSYWFWP